MRENNIDKLDLETAAIYATTFISDLPRTWRDLEQTETMARLHRIETTLEILLKEIRGFEKRSER